MGQWRFSCPCSPWRHRQIRSNTRIRCTTSPAAWKAYWDPAAPVPGYNAWCSGPGGTDKYYDDNAWVAMDFVEAYKSTHDPLFLQKAFATQRFVLSGWDDRLGGGLYWKLDHQGKNTCSNAPAAAAALSLSQATVEARHSSRGR